MHYEVEGVRPRGGPKKTCSEVTEKDCQILAQKHVIWQTDR